MSGSILITGGAGFLGRALTREALSRGYTRVCIYSRDEVKHAAMNEQFSDPRIRFFVGDVRDAARLEMAMRGVDEVISAAAMKRIEACHYNPIECKKTNVDGTANVIEAAIRARVKRVVGVSTDKAVIPVSTYGHSKAMAESLLLDANNLSGSGGPRFAVARYGNVWCSTGSIVPKWRAMIAAGHKSVPVTDPDCTRYFMRAEQAVDLVLNLVHRMFGGELRIPILPAYRVGDLAEAMGVEMNVTGLPDFEKKHETMDGATYSDTAFRMTVDDLRKELADV